MSTGKSPRVTRRRFLKQTGLTLAAASAPSLTAPFISRGLADTRSLSIVQWSHFVPEYDKWFDQFAKDWGTKNNIDVTVDHIPVANVAARAAAEASAQSGHDLFGWNGAGGAHLYRKFLVDVTSLVEATEKKYGKVSTIGRQIGYNQDDKTWSAFPDFYINFPAMYRKSMWDEIGMKPDTWDNVRIGGAKLKAKGHPVGISLGHSNDPNTTWRGLLWSFGGALQDAEGKNVVLNSKETVEAVKFVAALYKEAMTSEVLSWDDSSNNRYLVSGIGSMIVNPISAYRTFQKANKKGADDTFVMAPPKGPVRQIMGGASEFYGIWKFAKNKEAAKSLLLHLSQPDAIEKMVTASGGYDLPAFEKLTTLKTWAEEGPPKGTLYHYPNPHKHQVLSISASPAPPKVAQQIYTQATLTKMCVRFYQGEPMEKTLAWAEGEIEGFMRS